MPKRNKSGERYQRRYADPNRKTYKDNGRTNSMDFIFNNFGKLWLLILGLNIALIIFGIWVIVKLMQHFGVI